MTVHYRFASLTRTILLLVAASLPWGQSAIAQSQKQEKAASALTPTEKQAERDVRLKLAGDALEQLYKLHPEARQAVESNPGYAVFDITSVYAIFLVGQKGKGVLIDNSSKKATYMNSLRAGTGPGVGKQRVYQIFVFKNKGAMGQFVLAGGTGGDVGASASAGKEGI